MTTTWTYELVKALYWFGAIATLGAILTWLERKESALIQDRVGANRASILGIRAFGLPHIITDAVKMLTKEDFVPPGVPGWLHAAAPWITLVAAFLPMAAIPFGDAIRIGNHTVELQLLPMNVGLVYALAVASLAVYGVVLAGWITRNKWAVLGSLRGAAQMIAFGVALGISVVGAVIVYETLDLQAMVHWQNATMLHGWLPRWGIFFQPLGFILFLVVGIAETKRIPFDLPEGESEIIGYFLEYSGMKFGAFFLADFIETVMVAMMTTTLYLGGWSIPYLPVGGLTDPKIAVAQMLVFWVKVFLLCWFLLLVRWTLPRFRIDQALKLGWEYLVPLAILNIIITALVKLIV